MTPEQTKKLVLYRGFPYRGVYTVSPFVTKLEFRLRHADVAYEVQAGSPRTAPLGKIPYVDLSCFNTLPADEDPLLGDSTLITQRLVQWGVIRDLTSTRSHEEKCYDLALRALLEEKLYFYQSRERWEDNYYQQRDVVLHGVPYPLRIIIGLIIYRKIHQMLQSHGIGRYSTKQFEAIRNEMWQTLNDMLLSRLQTAAGKEHFWCLGGDHPSEADFTLYGFIVSVLVSPASPQSQDLVKALPGLMQYTERIHARWFPDYEKWDD